MYFLLFSYYLLNYLTRYCLLFTVYGLLFGVILSYHISLLMPLLYLCMLEDRVK